MIEFADLILSASLHLHPHLPSIRGDLDPAIHVCTQEIIALKCIQSFWRRQPGFITCSHAKHCQLWMEKVDQLGWIELGMPNSFWASPVTFYWIDINYGETVVKKASVRLAGFPLFTWMNSGIKLFPMLASPS